MIELCFKQTKLRVDFSFFAVLTVFLLCDRQGFGLWAIAACTAHELSHLLVMRCLQIPARSITLYGAGAMITSPETERAALWKQAAVYSAGIVMNLVFAAALSLFGFWRGAAVSLMTGLFNLLPLGEFDGARLLKLAAIRLAQPQHVAPAERIGNAASLAVLALVAGAMHGQLGITLLFTLGYIAAVALLRV